MKSANFVAGTLLMFCGGLIMTGTLALLPTILLHLVSLGVALSEEITSAGNI